MSTAVIPAPTPSPTNNLGRNKLDWKPEIWSRIDQAVHEEAKRTRIGARFLPIYQSDTLTVPSDVIETATMTIDETATTGLIEIWVEFALTPKQLEHEEELGTAITLATRATNLLSQGADILIFQGADGLANPLFASSAVGGPVVRHRGKPTGKGLLGGAKTVKVPLLADKSGYGENSFRAVSKAFSLLQQNGHNGPYALTTFTDQFADTHAPLPTTLIMPADRIKAFVTEPVLEDTDHAGNADTASVSRAVMRRTPHFFGTGTLRPDRAVMVSRGGNTMDLVIGMDPVTTFMQEDNDRLYRFQVVERFVLRVKDPTAIVILEFEPLPPE